MADTVRIKNKNRIKHVAANRVDVYLKQGYDQIDRNGKIVKRATGGKSVSLAEHNKALDELEALKDSDTAQKEIKNLKKENKSLKSKVTKLENAAKEDDKDGKEVS